MAAKSSVQGYVVTRNLAETTDDRQALNNIGGSPIADDIALFANNTKNESTLPIKISEYDSNTGIITIDNQTFEEQQQRSTVFTDGDVVSVENTGGGTIISDLYVYDSNAEDQFALSDSENLDSAYILSVSEDFVLRRKDVVTFQNLKNLTLPPSSIEDADSGNSSVLDNIDDYNSEFNNIYGIIDIAKYQSESKYLSNKSISTSARLRVEGGLVIRDPSDVISSEGIISDSPGLYLSDPQSDEDNIQTIRAFSSNSNPWEDDNAGTLSTDSTNVTAGNLILDNGLQIDGIEMLGESGPVDATNFTHKILVQIDGVDYYLCLRG